MKRYALCLLLLLLAITAQAAKVVTVGVVIDGPTEQPGWSLDLFKNELLVLTKDEFDVRFPPAKQLDGDWSTERIKAALKQLQDDPGVDMVLTLGYVSSQLAGPPQAAAQADLRAFHYGRRPLGPAPKGQHQRRQQSQLSERRGRLRP